MATEDEPARFIRMEVGGSDAGRVHSSASLVLLFLSEENTAVRATQPIKQPQRQNIDLRSALGRCRLLQFDQNRNLRAKSPPPARLNPHRLTQTGDCLVVNQTSRVHIPTRELPPIMQTLGDPSLPPCPPTGLPVCLR